MRSGPRAGEEAKKHRGPDSPSVVVGEAPNLVRVFALVGFVLLLTLLTVAVVPRAAIPEASRLIQVGSGSQATRAAREIEGRLMMAFSTAALGVVVGMNALILPFAWHPPADVSPLLGSYDLGLLVAATASRECFFLCVVVAATMLAAGAWTYQRFRGSGLAVARWLGGREVDWETADPNERLLLRVIEDLARTAGIPPPRAFVLDHEEGLNALAAGDPAWRSAICVTRGLLSSLSPDELRGIIAHETAHIVGRDSTRNLRLVVLLGGLAGIAFIGSVIALGGVFGNAPRDRYEDDRRKGDSETGAFLLAFFGVSIMSVGAVGLLCGRLIQAGICRVREQLADIHAVQIAGDRSGLGNALKKMWADEKGSKIDHEGARETAHMFCGDAVRPRWIRYFSTHPPIEERIRAIFPGWSPSGEEARALRKRVFEQRRASPAL